MLLKNILTHNPNDIKIPAIVKAELLHGVEKSQRRDDNFEKVSSFLLPYEILPFDDAATVHYARIKTTLETKGLVIGPNDLLIAAIALSHDATLVTNNTNEFSRIIDLSIVNWIN